LIQFIFGLDISLDISWDIFVWILKLILTWTMNIDLKSTLS